MRGQDAIIAARRAGSKPEWIDLLTERFPRGVPSWGIPAQWVFIEPSDEVRGLDLRFVIGCLVFAHGDDSARVRAVVEAAKTAGASRVIGHVSMPAAESFELLEIIDTDEVMTWHS